MGNCQAAEAATVVIQRPGGKVERIYWSASCKAVMNSNPGHYVAVFTASTSENGTTVKHVKILRPEDTLRIGHVYCLISFEEALKEFAGEDTKLNELLSMQRQQQRGYGGEKKEEGGRATKTTAPATDQSVQVEVEQQEACPVGRNGGLSRSRQWRPALQSIAEFGS